METGQFPFSTTNQHDARALITAGPLLGRAKRTVVERIIRKMNENDRPDVDQILRDSTRASRR
jgi:hypothetical protein